MLGLYLSGKYEIWLEFRKRVLLLASVYIVIFLALLLDSDDVYAFVASPLAMLLGEIPGNFGIITTSLTSPVITPIKLCSHLAMLFIVPCLLYQLWLFITPALYHNERRTLWLLSLLSCSLFYLGLLFSFYIILPISINFVLQLIPKGVTLLPDMALYLDWVWQICLSFGFAFQIPLLIVLLHITHLLPVNKAIAIRPYVVVIAFIIAMLLTPPDVLSQILLAVPICVLFELGIIITKVLTKKTSQLELIDNQ